MLVSVGRVVVSFVIRSASGRRRPTFDEPALLISSSSGTVLAFSDLSSGSKLGVSVVVLADVIEGEDRRPLLRAEDIGRDWRGAPLGKRRYRARLRFWLVITCMRKKSKGTVRNGFKGNLRSIRLSPFIQCTSCENDLDKHNTKAE